MKAGAALVLVVALTVLAQPAPASAQSETVLEPDTYRGEPYNAPVPATLAGARVVDADEALTLHAEGVPFIDVHPRTEKPAGLPEGTYWREPPHDTIPGAIWLWNTGYDRLNDAEQARLTDGLTEASGGDMAAPLVIFCRADCWMSWNAARRAVEMGYTGIIWFPGGTDAWTQALGDDLVAAIPVDD
ncbi:PQQ-dependent catabolism-associated CXXCW motif protein (plasmid) [Paracoccus sp. TK19116]|uniref:PQQ-dependent catabolism-associated CXXCW motif protein n=1 Tax=Paracoccus albicereus TaxID=2922394 RepID=A0ABT1MMH9_9RHOB|nr:PQQ-dependent catabolism-associated CXXCW motif protein [Paracoccus albicereus]MCQ0969309.1 PQQ-dependent catabolism-associated CXXCW motif protein [Paracoccus albicereus]